MGTMLQKMGMEPGTVPELLNFTRPDWILSIHRAYLDAGSQIVYANTFGANRHKLARTNRTSADVIAAAVGLAKEAVRGTNALVALDIGPIGELLEPLGTLTFEAAYDIFAEMTEAGAAAGADLVVIETMTDLYEAKAALLAAKEKTALPVFVTMSFEASGRTFTGCTAASMAHTLTGLGADAIGVNCSLGPKELLPLVQELRRHTALPLIAKPNAGLPDPEDGHYDLPPEEFAAAMVSIMQAGATLVGGCCGTDERYIAALKQALPEKTPVIAVSPPPLICTPTAAVTLDGVRVIGERVNPTGKKRFQQALLENDLDYIVSVAVQEMDAGADILDVNVGFPGVDEKTMLPRTVKAIQAAVDLPLQLDSVDPAALEAALRVYNGKAAVNSVSGKDESMDAILPIVKKYGAAVVGLTLDASGLPDSAEKRFAIAEKILNRAMAYGIPRQDVWIDCLTLTVSAQQEQAEETLKAVHRVRTELGLQTVLGVSNISFGLPNRPLVTQTFLIRALHAGLTLPIVNPNQREMMDAVAAFRVLSGEDAQCAAYVARFAQAQPEAKTAAAPSPASMTLEDAILRGLKAEAAKLAKELLKTEAPLQLVEQRLIPSLDKVGLDYEKGVVFLPQLLSAAQAAQAVFEEIKERLSREGAEQVVKGKLILATVQGDIHDIGKNIVKTVLQNYGYAVIDLGRDVAPETVVETAVRQDIHLVGLSALMTTTLPAMAETVRLLKQLPNPPFVMVGGAVVTPEYAQAIGADGYAKDARGAASIVRKAFGE
ncbi:MAG: homocysteine S-methyltransferase family protein [Clostridia bacterium]|nr:homocysteine S-methyltransferase family protein [Clostridia bacterium]